MTPVELTRTPGVMNHSEGAIEGAPSDDSGNGDFEEFVQLLTESQLMLHRYIASLLGGLDDARHVLQEVNLTLWRKRRDFTLGTNFGVWSRKVAFWQVRAFLRDRRRDRHVFNDELLELIADRSSQREGASDDDGGASQQALRLCLGTLTPKNRALIHERYANGLPIQALALKHDKTDNAMRVALLRIRRFLLRCIRKEMASA